MRFTVCFVLGALALPAVPALVSAHHAAAVDVNNRYLRLAPMSNGTRLAYTVYLGEIPGAEARIAMDRDSDGKVSDSEADAYADKLALEVASKLAIELDGESKKVTWADIHVGLGTPATDAGAFSIDLIGWLCHSKPGERHELLLVDGYRLDRPGETEMQVKPSPDVTITGTTLGRGGAPAQLQMTWTGEASPLAEPGYAVTYSIDPATAAAAASGPCEPVAGSPQTTAAGEPGDRKTSTTAVIVAAVAVFILLMGIALYRRRRGDGASRQNTNG